jgi:transposase
VPRTRPPYPAAFRAEAVELARSSGKTIPELAAALGVSGQTLRNWVHQADVDAGGGRPGELTTAEQQELRRLRRENQVLRQEREILKKGRAGLNPSAQQCCQSIGRGLELEGLAGSGVELGRDLV